MLLNNRPYVAKQFCTSGLTGKTKISILTVPSKMTAVSHFLMVYSGFYFPLPTGELCREREIFIRFYCIVCCRLPDSAESCLKSLCITASFLDLDHKRQKPIIRAPKG